MRSFINIGSSVWMELLRLLEIWTDEQTDTEIPI